MNLRILIGLGAGVLAVGAVAASAASLGGLNSASVGADQTVVASCDTNGIDMNYNTGYSAADSGYMVTEVLLSNVDAACNNLHYDMTLALSNGQPIAHSAGTLHVTAGNATFAIPAVSAKSVEKAALVITGPTGNSNNGGGGNDDGSDGGGDHSE
jgi:hypothetical protein